MITVGSSTESVAALRIRTFFVKPCLHHLGKKELLTFFGRKIYMATMSKPSDM
jgi:hypothetical protein